MIPDTWKKLTDPLDVRSVINTRNFRHVRCWDRLWVLGWVRVQAVVGWDQIDFLGDQADDEFEEE